jgi:hypothetical protein
MEFSQVRKNKPLIVVDINGVLADVRKTAHTIKNERGDFYLPNGQQVFINPFCKGLIDLISMHADYIIYTSRLRKNAEPILSYIFAIWPNLHHPIGLITGEDCPIRKDDDNNRPIKTIHPLLKYTRQPFNYTNFIFIDDNIQYISCENSHKIQTYTYDAGKPVTGWNKTYLITLAMKIKSSMMSN